MAHHRLLATKERPDASHHARLRWVRGTHEKTGQAPDRQVLSVYQAARGL